MNSAIMNTIQQYLDIFMDTVAERYDINREELTELWKETQKKKFKKDKKNKDKKSTVPSAYILFGKDERPKVMAENPDMNFVDVGRELGRRWRNASDKVKEYYKEKHDLLLKEKEEKKEKIVENIENSPSPSLTSNTAVSPTDDEEENENVVPEPEPEKPKKTKKPKETKVAVVEIPEEITNERERDLWAEFAKMTIDELRTQCDHNNIKRSRKRNDMIHALIIHRIALEDGNTQLDDDDDDDEK